MAKRSKKTIEHITHLGEKIAMVVRANHQVKDLEFFTGDQAPLQVGMHDKKKGVKLTPHIHLSNTKVITEIEEVLYIVKGKVRVTYYTIDGEKIDQKDLSKGDVLIHHKMGHGFEILEDAQIFEVKQGPYPGTKHAKIYFDKET